MFKKIKEAARNAATELDRRSSANQQQQDAEGASGEAGQGFLCPVCMVTFVSAELLQGHYEKSHADNDTTDSSVVSAASGQDRAFSANNVSERLSGGADSEDTSVVFFTCPQCFQQFQDANELQDHFQMRHESSERRDSNLSTMLMELNDLKASLEDEKHYSRQVKQEMDKLQSQVIATNLENVPTDEAGYLQQQITALEAGKAMVTSRMLEFEKESSTLKRSTEAVQREKERILERSALIAKDTVALRAQLDEESSQKMALGEELLTLKQTAVKLEKQLDTRPSEDDVELLRTELIHAQKLMDTMTREREEQIKQLQIQMEQAQLKIQQSEKTIVLLTDQLNAAPKSDDLQKLQSSIEATSDRLKEELTHKTDDNDRLQSELSEAVLQTKREEQRCAKLIEELATARTEMEKLSADLDASKMAFMTVEQQLISSNDDCTKLRVELTQVAAERDSTFGEAREKSTELEVKLADLKRELETLRSDKTLMEQQLVDLRKEKDALLAKTESLDSAKSDQAQLLAIQLSELSDVRIQIQQLERAAEKRDRDANDIETRLQQSTDTISRMETERAELLSKIQLGEGASSEAIEQLSREKQSLSVRIDELENASTTMETEQEAEKERLHKEIDEQSKSVAQLTQLNEKQKTAMVEMEESVKILNATVDQLSTELKAKTEELSMESEKDDEKKLEFDAKLGQISSAMDAKNEQLLQLAKEIDESHGQLEGQTQMISNLQVELAHERGELQSAVRKLEAAERKAEETCLLLSEMGGTRSELESKIIAQDRTEKELNRNLQMSKVALEQATEQWKLQEKVLVAEIAALKASLERELDDHKLLSETTSRLEEQMKAERISFDEKLLVMKKEQQEVQATCQLRKEENVEVVRKLDEMTQEKTRETQHLQESVSTKQQELLAVQESLDMAQAEMAQLMDVNEGLVQRVETLTDEKNLWSEHKNRFEAELERFSSETATIQTELSAIGASKANLEEELAAKIAEMDVLRRTADELKTDNEQSHRTLEETLRAIEEERSIWRSDSAQSEHQLQTECQQFRQRLAETEREFNECQTEKDNVLSQLTSVNELLSVSQSENVELTELNDEILAKCQRLETEAAKLKSDNEKTCSLVSEKEEKHAELNTELAHLRSQLEAVKSFANETEKEKDRLNFELDDVNAQLIAVTEETQRLTTQLQENASLMETCEQDKTNLQQSKDKLTTDIQQLTTDKEQLSLESQRYCLEHQNSIQDAWTNIGYLKEMIGKYRVRLATLKSRLDERDGIGISVAHKGTQATDYCEQTPRCSRVP